MRAAAACLNRLPSRSAVAGLMYSARLPIAAELLATKEKRRAPESRLAGF
jgi:hypothetical protein